MLRAAISKHGSKGDTTERIKMWPETTGTDDANVYGAQKALTICQKFSGMSLYALLRAKISS